MAVGYLKVKQLLRPSRHGFVKSQSHKKEGKMSRYIDGFVIPIPRARIDDYQRVAEAAAEIAWISVSLNLGSERPS